MESTEQSRTCTDATAVPALPTDFDVDHALGACGPAALRPQDCAGHIPAAPGHRLYGVEQGTATRDQVTAQREAIGDGWRAATEQPAAWDAFGAPLGPDEDGAA